MPASVAHAKWIGLDIETWLAEGLVDQLIPGGLPGDTAMGRVQGDDFGGVFAEMIALGHAHRVPVYPCLSWGFFAQWAFLDEGAHDHRTFVRAPLGWPRLQSLLTARNAGL